MIPLRLIFGEQSQHVVHVDATDINIVTERTVAAFPVPVSSYRLAIDTNLPQVVVSIQGIIQDDPTGGASSEKPSSVTWDIEGFYPTSVPAASSSYSAVQTLLQGGKLTLQPAFWRLSPPNCFGNYIVLQFNSTVSNRAGGVATPSVNASTRLAERSINVIIDVPIGGVLFSPTNGNPAGTLALIIQDALQLTTKVTTVSNSCDGTGGRQVNDAFVVSVDDSVITIQDTYMIQRYHTPLFRLNDQFNNWLATGATFNPSQKGSTKGMSAGDKAQNLLGLLANSNKNNDLLRGVQIPYNSLITSNEISPVVRNFFLTSGKVTPLQKGSRGNTRPSTQPMDIGKVKDDSDNGIIVSAVEAVGDVALDFLESAGISGLGDVLGDAWGKLTGAGTTNNGGISVLPESFHLTKEGANDYYQFDLQVISADHVIGVV